MKLTFAVFTELGKTSIRIKQNPIIFVWHFSFLSDQNFQTVGQLSSNYSEDLAKTDVLICPICMWFGCRRADPEVSQAYPGMPSYVLAVLHLKTALRVIAVYIDRLDSPRFESPS